MRSVPLALFWDFSRRGWWQTLLAQITVLGLAAIVYSSLQQSGTVDHEAGRGLYVVLVAIVFVAATGAELAAHGDPRRQYLLPLSNWSLAGVSVLPGSAIVAGMYALTAAVLNACFDVGWPVWGTAACFAAGFASIRAAAQIAGSGRLARFLAWCCIGIPLANWWRARFRGGWFLAPETMWTTVTWGEWVSIGLVMVIAFVAMAHAIARERRGDAAWLASVEASARRVWTRSPASRKMPGFYAARRSPMPFRSDRAAQFWFEWRQKGLILPATLAAFTAFLVVGCVCGVFQNPEYELLHGLLGYGIVFAPIALVAGLVLGHIDLPQANAECGTLLGTRPMSNAALSMALLKVEAASLLLTWGLWAAITLGATVLLYVQQGAAPVLDLWTDHGRFQPQYAAMGSWYAVKLVVVALIAAWIPLTLASALVLTGRRHWTIGCVVATVPVFLGVIYLSELHNNGVRIVSEAAWQLGWGGTAAIVTVASFVHARRKRLIDGSTCGAALAGWLALCALGAGVSWWLQSTQAAYAVFAAGVFSLTVTPLAMGPVALAWNRHR